MGLKIYNKTPNHFKQLQSGMFAREIKNTLTKKAYYTYPLEISNDSW